MEQRETWNRPLFIKLPYLDPLTHLISQQCWKGSAIQSTGAGGPRDLLAPAPSDKVTELWCESELLGSEPTPHYMPLGGGSLLPLQVERQPISS